MPQPHKFTDNNGDDWILKVNPFTLAKIEAELGVSFSTQPEDEDGPIIRIVTDCLFAFRVLWILIEPKATEKGISSEAFADALVGDPLGQAQAALCEAIADFHPSPERRATIRRVFGVIKTAETKLLAKANDQLDTFNIDAAVEEVTHGG